ncbi:MAG: SMI1/KNR4 family protein [Planctomycetota bacterium]
MAPDPADPLAGFDLEGFWESTDEGLYQDSPLDAGLLARVEADLGRALPASYVKLLSTQNGGVPARRCFPHEACMDGYLAIEGILGIGYGKDYSLCGRFGSAFMHREWGYPEHLVPVCRHAAGAHVLVALDYAQRNAQGEPAVVYVSEEADYEGWVLAETFEAFVRGLVPAERFDTQDEDLRRDLQKIDTGAFSSLLSELLRTFGDPDLEARLRRVCRELTLAKGFFALHGEPLSELVYDLQFLLYTASKPSGTPEEYLRAYPAILTFSDGDFDLGGYSPSFVEAWLKTRRRKKQIVAHAQGDLRFTDAYRAEVLERVATRFPTRE